MYLIRSAAIDGYENLVRDLGHNPLQLLSQSGLTSAQLREPNLFISYENVAKLLDMSARHTGQPLFGFRLGKTQDISVLGDLGLISIHQPTLSDALKYASQNLRFHANGILLSHAIERRTVKVKVEFRFTNDSNLRQLKQLSVQQLANGFGQVIGTQSKQLHIHLKQSLPTTYDKPLKQVEFNSDFDGISLPAGLLQLSLSKNQALLSEYFEQMTVSLQNRFPDDLIAQIKHIIAYLLPSGECNLPTVANTLGLHPRVLQLKLKAQHTRFSDVLWQCREEIARQQLQYSNISITDLALNLGYSELAVFSRNFKQQSGLTPRQWRNQNKKI